MSRLRWGLGAVLSLVALLAAESALRTYVGQRLWLGGLSVVVLAAIDLFGFASLAHARRRLAAEIAALGADPPSGTLLAERRRRLQELHATAARPDLDALAEATAAVELGRAYLGKYLVAVTVLVGLVGTFAGLMETLRGVAPLLADEHITTLQALAGPLAGLDVTFGASLVGILVTLALALVQGDLLLAEQEVLARLEERTRHVLVPSLWPPAEAAEERAARELSALRGELSSFVVRAAAAAGKRVRRVAATEVDRLVRGVRASVEGSVQDTAARVEKGLLAVAATAETKLAQVLAVQQERFTALTAASEHASASAIEASGRATDAIVKASAATLDGIAAAVDGVSAAQERLLSSATGALDDLAGASRESVERLQTALRALGESQAATSAQLLTTHQAETARLGAAQDEAARRTEDALSQLAVAQAGQVARFDELQAEGRRRAEAALTDLVTAHAASLTRLDEAHAASVQRVEEALHALTTAQAVQHAALKEGQAAAAARVENALAALVETQAARLATTTKTLCEAVHTAVGGEGLRLKDAAQALEKAAGELGVAAQAMGAPITALTPELSALAREVALLAARSESEEPTATLHELIRLGEGVERLEALLRMAKGQAEAQAEAQAKAQAEKRERAA